jgi:hypothetical protein
MKTIALCSILLFAACSSSDGLIDKRSLECGPGAAIEIEAGLDSPRVRGTELRDDNITLLVEVTNNSHEDITVRNIYAEQLSTQDANYLLDRGHLAPNATLSEDDSRTFKLPVSGRPVPNFDPRRARGGDELVLALTVELANGDSYRCRFSVPSPVM